MSDSTSDIGPARGANQPITFRVDAGDVSLAGYEWNAARRGHGPTLLFVHATGFHARCWDPVVRRLGDRHMIAIDQRGHGRSDKNVIEDWRCFGEDLARLARVLDLVDVVGIGHSMGGHALVDAAAAEPTRLLRLVLIDPVIAEAGAYGAGGWTIALPGAEPHPTARRKRVFESPEAMIERFRDRAPYRVFEPEALEAYCRFGLLPIAEGRAGEGYELACPPEVEASIYMTSRTNAGVHDSVRALELPVLILRAKLPAPDRDMMDFSSSPTWPGLVGEFRNAREIHFEDRTHFLPMEIPEEVAALIEGEL